MLHSCDVLLCVCSRDFPHGSSTVLCATYEFISRLYLLLLHQLLLWFPRTQIWGLSHLADENITVFSQAQFALQSKDRNILNLRKAEVEKIVTLWQVRWCKVRCSCIWGVVNLRGDSANTCALQMLWCAAEYFYVSAATVGRQTPLFSIHCTRISITEFLNEINLCVLRTYRRSRHGANGFLFTKTESNSLPNGWRVHMAGRVHCYGTPFWKGP